MRDIAQIDDVQMVRTKKYQLEEGINLTLLEQRKKINPNKNILHVTYPMIFLASTNNFILLHLCHMHNFDLQNNWNTTTNRPPLSDNKITALIEHEKLKSDRPIPTNLVLSSSKQKLFENRKRNKVIP